jgi:hypothetical protein
MTKDCSRMEPTSVSGCLLSIKWPHTVVKKACSPFCLTVLTGSSARLGQLVDAFNAHVEHQTWEEARIVEDRTPDTVLVKFRRFPPTFNMVFDRTSPLLAQWGSKSRVRIPYKPRSAMYWQGRQRGTRFGQRALPTSDSAAAATVDVVQPEQAAIDARFAAYLAALARLGLTVHAMGGDGNCLFRAVAHQVYGDQELHRVTRASAADYMEAEARWFSSFVVGDESEFGGYIAAVRRDAVWGDDPEIQVRPSPFHVHACACTHLHIHPLYSYLCSQALCELYDRPAEIYAFDPVEGARKLRVFHSARADARPPIRLSYFGGGHYDSVVGLGWRENLLREAPGSVEARRIAASRALASSAAGGGETAALAASDVASTEDATVAAALALSRDEFDASAENIDAALLSVELAASAAAVLPSPATAHGSTDAASLLQMSSGVIATVSSASSSSAERSLEEQILRRVLQATAPVDEVTSAVLERSRALAEEEVLQASLRASMSDRSAPEQQQRTQQGGGVEDSEMQAALELSWQQQQQQQHVSSVPSQPLNGARSAGGSSLEEQILQSVLQASAPADDANALYNLGLDMSEEQQIARLLQLSRDEGAASSTISAFASQQQSSGTNYSRDPASSAAALNSGSDASRSIAGAPQSQPIGHFHNSVTSAAGSSAAPGVEDDDDEGMLQAALAASLQPL